MQFISNILTSFFSKPVSCNQSFPEDLPHDQMVLDQDFQPTHNNTNRKVPGFDHLLNPVIAITGQHELIKGFKFDLSIPLSQSFQIQQTWQMPNSGVKQQANMMQMMMGKGPAKPTFSFMAQGVLGVTNPYQAPDIVLMGKMQSDGRVDSVLVKKLTKNLNLKLTANFMNNKTEDGALSADIDYQDKDSTGVLKFQHHPMQGLVGSLNYMQRIHRNLMLGFDYTQLFAHKKHMFSYGAKVFVGDHSLYASSIQGGSQYHLGYIIPIKKGLTFVSHYKLQQEGGSTTTFGFKQKTQTLDITATANTKSKLTTVLGMKGPLFRVNLSAQIDYKRDHYSFGYGISIGPQQ